MMCIVCGINHTPVHGNMSTPFFVSQNMRHVQLRKMRGNMAKCIFCSLFINILQHFYPHHTNLTLPALQQLEISWINDQDSQDLGEPLEEGIMRLHPSSFSYPPEPIIEIYGFKGLVQWPGAGSILNTVSELPDRPDSAATWEFIHSQLDECISQHNDSCSERELPRLPTRTIEITSTAPWAVRVHESRPEESAKYTTLSYRWGDQPFLMTKPGELDSMKAAIPWLALPVLFQEAAEITSRLGLKYIWIDALCIIQGNQSDFNIEAPKMADYYGNSHLTIISDSSPSPHQSVFNTSRGRWIGKEFQVPHRNGDVAVKARQSRAHNSFSLNSHVSSRAWTWQERVLSKRCVHYNERDVSFECQSKRETTEDGLLPVEWQDTSTHYRLEFPPQQIDSNWADGLSAYSLLNYTKSDDRLPAIAGFAKTISAHKKSNYTAGLWEDDFLANLLWMSAWNPRIFHPAPREALRESIRPPEVIGQPSWSWASISGRIMNKAITGISYDKSRQQGLARILEKECVLAGPSADPFGKVSSGYVRIQAPIEQGSLVFDRRAGWSLMINDIKQPGLIFVDILPETAWTTTKTGASKFGTRRKRECPKDRSPPPMNVPITAVYVLSDPAGKEIHGLLLGSIGAWANVYERIGIFHLYGVEAEDKLNGLSKTLEEAILTII